MSHQLYIIRTRSFGFINYVYIIVDERTKKAALIDPSWEFNKIYQELERLEVKLTAILLTHSHMDHVNLSNNFARCTDANVYMSKEEIAAYNFRCHNLCELEDGDFIELGDTLLYCLLTPGHTLGSACYMTNKYMFTGDTLFMEGCGLCMNTSGAMQMYDSIQRIKKEVNKELLVYPGHCYDLKNGYSLGNIIKFNIYFSIEEKEQFVKFRMRPNNKHLFDFR